MARVGESKRQGMSGERWQWLRIASSSKTSKELRFVCEKRSSVLLLLVLLTLTAFSPAAQKIRDADCLTCHADASLAAEENGKQVSLFVDQNKLKHSFHGRLFGCVDCHTDVKSLAHDTPPKKITCA